jgi:RNA-directed DNA polymerase
MFTEELMEEICEAKNLRNALTRVIENDGAPGIDNMQTEKLLGHLRKNWNQIKTKLLQRTYKPNPVRRVDISKPNGKGTRKLGIPCVVDRFIQQAVMQVLQKRFDPTFSKQSYGFRPGKSAHQAIRQAQEYLKQGHEQVVDIDLEKFFDRISHDRLISALSKKIQDKRVIALIRSFLNAGVMEKGLFAKTDKGTPQGGPLSPLLSNIVLDELDRELEARGHKFVRYADDCNIYVKSKRAGQRVMKSISNFITHKLLLKVNESKSAVARPQERTFLGFSFTGGNLPNRRKIAEQSIEKFKNKIRKITNRNYSISLEDRVKLLKNYINGWKAYFCICETPSVLKDLDCWIRRRLRCVLWKQWKVYSNRMKELIRRGVRPQLAYTSAWSSKGPWNIAHTPAVRIALPNKFFDSIKLPRLWDGK